MTAIRFADLPVGHPGRRLLSGYTPSPAAQADQRFSCSLFVPEDQRDDEPSLQPWVFVHGTGRRTVLHLDAFADLAQVVVGSLDDPAEAAAVAPDGDGLGRPTRARTLRDALRELGSSVRLDVVAGAGHDGAATTGVAAAFQREQLSRCAS